MILTWKMVGAIEVPGGVGFWGQLEGRAKNPSDRLDPRNNGDGGKGQQGVGQLR